VNRPGRVRDGLLTDGYDIDILPVEAAVAAQRADALRMLLANGATVDERELRVLRCLEVSHHDAGTREILDARSSGPADCAGVQLPTDRTR
jgi:hypothetical protein